MMSMIFLMANALAAPQPGGYVCKVAIFAQDLLPAGYETTTVQRPFSTGQSHGGTPYEFSAGEHQVGIVADGLWRGIIWKRAGKDVAQVLTVSAEPILGNHVIMLTNPANLEEQVQMVCDPSAGEFPKE